MTKRVYCLLAVLLALDLLLTSPPVAAQSTKASPKPAVVQAPSLEKRVAALEKALRALEAELAGIREEIAGALQAELDGMREEIAMIDRAKNEAAPAPTRRQAVGSDAPSEAEVRACVAAAPTQTGNTYGRLYGNILRVEFGTPTISQGGMMDMGAPQGTRIFPTKIHFPGNYTYVFHVFRDSFGEWKCHRM